MHLKFLLQLVLPLLRQAGQSDLASRLEAAVQEIEIRLGKVEEKVARLEEKYQLFGRDLDRMIRARRIRDGTPLSGGHPDEP